MIEHASQAAELLRGDCELQEETLYIQTGDFCMGVRSNSREFLRQLRHYFTHVVTDACQADVIVEAYNTDVMELDLDWKDWAREPGKAGRKDTFFELSKGRLLRKVRTGMVFLQSQDAVIARGPCSSLDNQVINFINSQYMNWLQQQEWLICHASGLDVGRRGVAMAGLSGGGKSTLMLAMMDYPDVRYVTNDRLFIRRQGQEVIAVGIPKLPRINPGTIVNNPALYGLIDPERRAALLALPREELWHLEEKHDVLVSEIYGDDRIAEQVDLDAFLVLNWSHDSEEPTTLTEVSLESRTDLLPAIMKSPGPFYQFTDGSFYQDSMQLEEQAYLDTLQGVTILEASGRVDIAELEKQLYQWLHH
jgi:HprK-related kinase B